MYEDRIPTFKCKSRGCDEVYETVHKKGCKPDPALGGSCWCTEQKLIKIVHNHENPANY